MLQLTASGTTQQPHHLGSAATQTDVYNWGFVKDLGNTVPPKYGPPTVPRFRLNNYGRRAFSAADRMAWNSLPGFIYGIQRAAQTVLGVLVRALLVHPAH